VAKKLDPKKLKEEFEALDDDEKASIREAIGAKEDDETAGVIKKLLDRVTALEGLIKDRKEDDGSRKKSGGFFDAFRI
jgi:hypothetical protein